MATDGILKTNALDKAILDATQGQTIGENYEAMRAALHAAVAPPTNESSPPAAPTEWEFSKEIYWHESTGRRPLVIKAHTAEDLAALERQVTR
jgi:hypothetical protein